MSTAQKFPKGRYLVTGGAGFIGSHLCEQLASAGNELLIVDNTITGDWKNLTSLEGKTGIEFKKHDITNPFTVDGPLSGVFHLASPASPVDYAKLPLETLRVGSVGSDHTLAIALEKNCPILVTSTSEVYGDPLEHPQEEKYWGHVNPIGPRSCYDESKRYLEAITMAYHRTHQLDTKIVRIFNTYGPRMRSNDGRVVPNFCMQALRNEAITIYGDGTQTRSFCYVDDMVEGLMRAFLNKQNMPINLGNPVEYTITDFARNIIELSNSKSTLSNTPLPEDDPKVRCPDITKAKQLLQWEPKVELIAGLRRTLDYFRTQL